METTLTPTLFHTQIGGHAHSLTHALSLSLSHKNSPFLNLSLTHLLSLSYSLSLSLSLTNAQLTANSLTH